jgi:hypothetical protein
LGEDEDDIVNFLTAPLYLFDEIDTLDKVDYGNLVPLTRVTIRIVQATATISAAQYAQHQWMPNEPGPTRERNPWGIFMRIRQDEDLHESLVPARPTIESVDPLNRGDFSRLACT